MTCIKLGSLLCLFGLFALTNVNYTIPVHFLESNHSRRVFRFRVYQKLNYTLYIFMNEWALKTEQ